MRFATRFFKSRESHTSIDRVIFAAFTLIYLFVIIFLDIKLQAVLSIFGLLLFKRSYQRSALLFSFSLSTPFLLLGVINVFPEYANCSVPPAQWRDHFLFFRPAKKNISWSCVGNESEPVTYRIGRRGLRGRNDPPTNKNETPIFFAGCSFTYGMGKDEGQTLPAVFEKKSQEKFAAYNLGVPGGGLQNAIRYFRELSGGDGPLNAEGKEPIFIYTFLADHVLRFARAEEWNWIRVDRDEPYYTISGDGDIVDAKATKQVKLLRYVKFKLGQKAYANVVSLMVLFKQHELGQDYRGTAAYEKWLHNYVQGIYKLSEEFYARYPKGEFVLNFWPPFQEKFSFELAVGQKVLHEFKRLQPNAHELMYPALSRLPAAPGGSGHPTSEAIDNMAEFLKKNI